MDIKNTTKKITVVDTSDPDLSAYTREIGAEAENIEVSRNHSGQIVPNGEDVIKEELNVTLNNIENKTYNINDASSTDINDTDYIPMSNSEGTEKKKSTWAVLISKIKQVFGIQSETGDETKFLNKKGEWTEPANTWEANSVSKDGYVTKGNGQNNKIWKTDANGNPSWREYDNLSFHIVNTLDANVVLEDGIWQVRGSIKNAPLSNQGVFWNVKSIGTPHQIYMPDNLTDVYKRWYTNGVWSAWNKLDTNTWRGIQNNLTSDSTTDSLAAAQGQALKTLIDGKAATNHTHLYAGSSSAGGAANNALALDGHPASTSAAANSIAMRQGNGYLYATYFNQSSGDESMNTSSKFMFTNNDGFLRKGTIASAKTALGLGSAAYSNTSAFAATGHTHLYAGSTSAGGDANNALKLLGRSLSPEATANTVALRTPEGDLVARSFRQTNSQIRDIGSSSYIMHVSDNLGYLYKGSINSLKSALGLGSAAYTNSTAYAAANHTHSNYLPLSGGTMTGGLKSTSSIVTKSYVGSIDHVTAGTASETISGTTYTNKKGFFRIYDAKGHYLDITTSDNISANKKATFKGTGTVGWDSSSRRVKENIRDISEQEAKKLLDVNIVKFDYKKDWNDGEKNLSGVIAEDVIKIYPETVHIFDDYNPDLPPDAATNLPPEVDYRRFVPYLIKMVQIQQKEIDELKAKIKGD